MFTETVWFNVANGVYAAITVLLAFRTMDIGVPVLVANPNMNFAVASDASMLDIGTSFEDLLLLNTKL